MSSCGGHVPLAIVGLGVCGRAAMTVEARARLDDADVIYMVEPRPVAERILSEFRSRVISLDFLFDCHPRRISLEKIAEHVADASVRDRAPAFAFRGDALFASRPAERLVALLRGRGRSFSVIPGVSSFARFFADLGIDPLSTGVQVVTGSQVHRITSSLPVVIIAPGYAATVRQGDRLRALAHMTKSLIEIYGGDSEFWTYSHRQHEVDLTRVAAPDVVGIIERGYLGDTLVAGPVHLLTASGSPDDGHSAERKPSDR